MQERNLLRWIWISDRARHLWMRLPRRVAPAVWAFMSVAATLACLVPGAADPAPTQTPGNSLNASEPAPVVAEPSPTPAAATITAAAPTPSAVPPTSAAATSTAPVDEADPSAYSAQTACDHPYFPLRQNAEWHFESDQGAYSWTVTDVSGDLHSATAIMQVDFDETDLTYHWICDDAGLVSYDFGNLAIRRQSASAEYELLSASGVWLAPASEVQPGATWERRYMVRYSFDLVAVQAVAIADVLETITIRAVEPVDVAAGQFETLPMQDSGVFDINIDDAGSTVAAIEVIYSLAYGVGVVRQVSSSAEGANTAELVSYSLP